MIENYKEILYDNQNIETKRLKLRKATKNDVLDMLEYASDAETVKYLDWTGAKTTDEIIKGIIDFHWSNPGVWVIELRGIQKCIGTIDIRIKPEHEKAEFGFVLNRNFWNKGYMTEVLSVILELCFVGLDLNRVESFHYVGNEGSGKVMQKCGMKFEGISEKAVIIKGIFRDIVRYGITKEHWHNLDKKK
jgi:ribosomal-protein-alanine N-acetyltransferase